MVWLMLLCGLTGKTVACESEAANDGRMNKVWAGAMLLVLRRILDMQF
jgi:hypothetical protein